MSLNLKHCCSFQELKKVVEKQASLIDEMRLKIALQNVDYSGKMDLAITLYINEIGDHVLTFLAEVTFFFSRSTAEHDNRGKGVTSGTAGCGFR